MKLALLKDNELEKIYREYPLKVGKPAALKAIRKALQTISAEDLLIKTKAFYDARNGDFDFIPNPATWFNQHRFNDDPSTWKPRNENNARPDKPNPRNIGVSTDPVKQRQLIAAKIKRDAEQRAAERAAQASKDTLAEKMAGLGNSSSTNPDAS